MTEEQPPVGGFDYAENLKPGMRFVFIPLYDLPPPAKMDGPTSGVVEAVERREHAPEVTDFFDGMTVQREPEIIVSFAPDVGSEIQSGRVSFHPRTRVWIFNNT